VWLPRGRLSRTRVRPTDADAAQPEQPENLQEAFARYPVSLMGIHVTDIFYPDEWAQLAKHLLKEIPKSADNESHDSIRAMFDAAERRSIGSPTVEINLFNPLYIDPQHQPRSGTSLPYPSLPPDFASVTITLSREDPEFVMMELSSRSSTREGMLLSVLTTEVPSGGMTFNQVLAGKFTALGKLAVFPRDIGALRDRRYPCGTWIVWTINKMPDTSDEHWCSLETILGFSSFPFAHHDGKGFLLWPGVPGSENMDDFADLSEWSGVEGSNRRMGYSVVVPLEFWARKIGIRGSLAAQLYIEQLLGKYRMPLLAESAAAILDDEAGALAAELGEKSAYGLQRFRISPLRTLVTRMDACEYRVSRLNRWLSENEFVLRRSVDRYELTRHGPLAEGERHGPLPPGPAAITLNISKLMPTKRNDNEFLAGVRRELPRILERAGEDIRSSRERASSLLELTSTSALVIWTIVIGVVGLATLVTVLVTSL
jgi:hypothetical protein